MNDPIEILVVLGGPNASDGALSPIVLSRLNYCKQVFTPQKRILCTGGFGPQFNTTNTPHADYAISYLMAQGIHKEYFLAPAYSSNTVEDAVKIKPIIAPLHNITLTIISSDFHVKRATYIFNHIVPNYPKKFVGVSSNLEAKELASLVRHESKALERILQNGLYF